MNKTTIDPYDAALLEHQPLIRRLAHGYCGQHPYNGEPDDFAQDVCELALARAKNYRATYKFATWIHYLAGWVATNRKQLASAKRRTGRTVAVPDSLAVAPRQHDYTELSDALRRLPGTREAGVALRVAMGDEGPEIANDMGISRERVRQLKVVGQRQIGKALGVAA